MPVIGDMRDEADLSGSKRLCPTKPDKGAQMFQIVVNPDMKVEIPQVGIFYAYEGNEYVCLSTVTYQEQDPNSDKEYMPVFSTKARLLRINDEGDDMGEPSIEVNADKLTEI